MVAVSLKNKIYGPYGSETFSNFNQALLNAQNCYKLKSEGEDLSKSAKRIKKLNKLYVIDLKENNIDSLPESISNFRNLMYLKSSGNPLRKLPESIGNTPTIKTIILHHTVLDSLPYSFNNLGSLAELEIQVNNSDTFFTKEALKGLYNLKSIMLYKINLKEFPKGLQTNRKLKKIMMIDCHLTKLDSLFGQSKSVQTLILDKNQLLNPIIETSSGILIPASLNTSGSRSGISTVSCKFILALSNPPIFFPKSYIKSIGRG